MYAIRSYYDARPAPERIRILTRTWFNASDISRNFLVPGSISVVMTIIGALLTSLVVASYNFV